MARRQTIVFPIPDAAYRLNLRRAVQDALREDLGQRDLTTTALHLEGKHGAAVLIVKEQAVLAGADAFEATFRALDPVLRVTWHRHDGQNLRKGMRVATITGNSAAILTGERTALNFVAHLSGVASTTSTMVSLLRGRQTRLLDTRKTTPGLRLLEKRATLLGGAVNHRMGLYDAVMIKDNHIAAVGDLAEAIRRASARRSRDRLICEVRDLNQIRTALDLGMTWLLLDNFTLERLQRAVRFVRQAQHKLGSKIQIEVSGGVTPRRLPAIARLEVDYISSGQITHSAPAVDFSLEWSGPPAKSRQVAKRRPSC